MEEILNKIGENIPSIITGITAILTAFFSGLFTWLISRNQIKIKETELQKNNEFEARKLIFSDFEKKLDKHSVMSEESTRSLAKIYTMFLSEGFENNVEEVKGFIQSQKKIVHSGDNYFNELKYEAEKANITEQILMDKINEGSQLDEYLRNYEAEYEDLETEFFKIKRYYELLHFIQAELLESKSNLLFKKYI